MSPVSLVCMIESQHVWIFVYLYITPISTVEKSSSIKYINDIFPYLVCGKDDVSWSVEVSEEDIIHVRIRGGYGHGALSLAVSPRSRSLAL